MALTIVNEDIFGTGCTALVNPVNCVGVMGAGLAALFKNRYQKMFLTYRSQCVDGLYLPGKVYYHHDQDGIIIVNITTKDHWRNKSKYEWVESALKEFRNTYSDNGVASVAFPLLGTGNGGLVPEKVLELMLEHLSDLDLDIKIVIRK